ncbi:hypothetical protein BMI86_05395 [Thioclava sp. DLFJ5-1]|uniref:hypothetical protein n=1 Tax=Thioclava sp. DLFJ5-1 TaxID=1915314 RepID=UPI00099762F4|nr:hypothetical protein [Thioclava sp. DLFJ5-1]OOY22415.1 hypothetical protein BMI86_05395 [Thioclava sp. DLFJ5-1]
MSQIASLVLGTVNAPYGANLSAHQLAQSISDIDAAKRAIGPVFAFFSEVPLELQNSFVSEMGLSPQKVHEVARHLQSSCPFPLALAQ